MLDDSIDLSAAATGLAVGDVVAVVAFVVAGELRHWPRQQAIERTPETALPFVVGWLVASAALGLYARDARAGATTGAVNALAGWTVAVVVGQALRATPYLHGGFDAAFFLVSLLVGGALLGAWRGAAGYLAAR